MIRRVQPRDLFSVISLAYESLSERYDPVIFSTFYESFPQGFLIAEKKQKIIGFIVGIPIDDSTIKIVLFSVDKTNRCQGAGSLLLNSLIDKMKQFDMQYIKLEVKTSNTSAICFYQKHGFKKIHRINNFYQSNESAFVMKKNI